MLRVVIKDASVVEKQIRTKSGDFMSREQFGWVEFPSGEIRKVRVALPRGGEPYKAGSYTLGFGSFIVGQWGDLELARQLELVPAAAGAVGPAGPSARSAA